MTSIILGASGMLGSAIQRELESRGEQVIAPPRSYLDLEDANAVFRWLLHIGRDGPKPLYLCAAKVGGIGRNIAESWEMLRANLAIQQNVFTAAEHTGAVSKLLFVGSSCMYPRDRELLREEDLMSGPLEPTNEAYAIAKLAGLAACKSLLLPCVVPILPNLYGPGDNFDLGTSHVVAAMIRKFHEAKVLGAPSVTLWGTGKPTREFLHVDDAALACVELMHRHIMTNADERGTAFVRNVGGVAMNIEYLALSVSSVVGYTGDIVWDTSHPDGFPSKVMVNSTWTNEFPCRVEFHKGLEQTYRWFCSESMRHFDRPPKARDMMAKHDMESA